MVRIKPNTLIIGSAKCGTTSLAETLDNHPDCLLSIPKEVNYFDNDENYKKGDSWYSKHFEHYINENIVIDATPNYAAMPDNLAAERIYKFNPEMKLIYIVRNPIKRLISSWKMHYYGVDNSLKNEANKGFENYVYFLKQKTTHWHHYKFRYQLEHYRKYFDAKNIHVMFLEDLIQNKDAEFKKLYQFLNIDRPSQIELEESNTAENRTQIKPLFNFIYKYKIDRFIKYVLPNSSRNLFKRNIKIHQKITYPDATISIGLQNDFLNFITEDINLFLKENNKPLNYWRLNF